MARPRQLSIAREPANQGARYSAFSHDRRFIRVQIEDVRAAVKRLTGEDAQVCASGLSAGGRDGEKSAEDTLELVATFRSRPAFHWVTRGLPATRRVVAVRAMRQALFTAHLGTTVIHGDVHPGNVLVRCGVPHADPVFIGARARLARAQGRQLGASILGSPRARCDGITARSRECISHSVASRPCSRKTCAAPTGGLALPMLSLERFATTFTSLLERAGEMSWDRCHYYASRYAERGCASREAIARGLRLWRAERRMSWCNTCAGWRTSSPSAACRATGSSGTWQSCATS